MNEEIKSYLAAIGSKGGMAKSRSKRIASQKNGARGGRPKLYQETSAYDAMNLLQSEDWKISFMNFVDGFRRRPSKNLLLKDPLPVTRDKKLYALLQSICLQLCLEKGISPKGWLLKKSYLAEPWFVSGMKSLYATALKESPVAFRRNNIFVMQNFLSRV